MKTILDRLFKCVLLLLACLLFLYGQTHKTQIAGKDKEIVFLQKVIQIGTLDIMLACRQLIDQRNEFERNNRFPEEMTIPSVIKELNPWGMLVYENQIRLHIIGRTDLVCFSEGLDGYGSVMLTNGFWYVDSKGFEFNATSSQMKPIKTGWIIDRDGRCKLMPDLLKSTVTPR